MKIEILGTGCSKCKTLFEMTQQAVAKSGQFAEIIKVENPIEIMKYGVTSTPALVVNGEVKISGKTPGVEEIVKLLDHTA